MMNITDKNIEKYIKNFKTHFNGSSRQPFHEIRKNAIERVESLGFPNTKQEEWRFTNPAPIIKSDFKIAEKNNLPSVSEKDIEPFLIKDWVGSRVVFIDGFYSEALSTIKDVPGISINSLLQNLEENDETVSRISSIALFENEVFTALNTAFTDDGSFINIAENREIKDSIHVLHISSTSGTLTTNRNMILVGKNAQATVIESYHSLNNDGGFVNTVTEIFVDENAKFNHYKLQDESQNHFHIGTTAILQKANPSPTPYFCPFCLASI